MVSPVMGIRKRSSKMEAICENCEEAACRCIRKLQSKIARLEQDLENNRNAHVLCRDTCNRYMVELLHQDEVIREYISIMKEAKEELAMYRARQQGWTHEMMELKEKLAEAQKMSKPDFQDSEIVLLENRKTPPTEIEMAAAAPR